MLDPETVVLLIIGTLAAGGCLAYSAFDSEPVTGRWMAIKVVTVLVFGAAALFATAWAWGGAVLLVLSLFVDLYRRWFTTSTT